MYIKIHKMELQKNQYWNDLLISRIWLYQDDDKRIRRVKLDDPKVIKILLSPKQLYEENQIENQESKEN